ncbi:Na+/Pi-cotransporter [candidate division SR1 bacterium Aalborg_AAW-1]|nr:Na+/Pi-cotransporter [candidate division SR1 bacterium Aalborg_AAW-1]
MNRWILFAGLGMIRFGMEMFEESLKKLGGPKLSQILQQYTDKGWKATLVGTIVTGILNSSTLVSLLTLGFVSAGMMKLVNAVGVLVGANIGSTATGLIVGYLGFGEFKISMFALPLIAIGGIIMILSGKKYRGYWAKLLIGFGLFFLGIDFLKENVEVMSQVFNFEQYKDMSIWIFGLIGMIVTAMVQSSGAVGVMTLAALSSGIITFEAGFAIILGANIGTSFTALIASFSGTTAKRQIGIANLLFNIITVIIGIILFYPFIWLTLDVLGFKENPVIGNAIINFVFNLITSIAFIPFLGLFTKLIQRVIPEKEEIYPLQIIQHPLHKEQTKYDDDMATLSINALETDKKYLIGQVLEYISSIWGIDTHRIRNQEPNAAVLNNMIKFDNEQHRELYQEIKEQLDTVFAYINQLSLSDLDAANRQKLMLLQKQFISLSNACKATENVRENIQTVKNSLDKKLSIIAYEMIDHIIAINKGVYSIIDGTSYDDTQSLSETIREVSSYRDDILNHIAPYIVKGNVGDMDISSLVNMSREVTDGYKDITYAVEQPDSHKKKYSTLTKD